MDKIEVLYEKFKTLRIIPKIKSNEDEAYLLSLALVDIEESANEIIALLKEINTQNEEESIIENLALIGEDLRHIIYHIKHSKYYDYLMSDDFSDTV